MSIRETTATRARGPWGFSGWFGCLYYFTVYERFLFATLKKLMDLTSQADKTRTGLCGQRAREKEPDKAKV